MEPVRKITGRAVPLDRADVDTDQIIPASWLKRIERTGFGEGLFSAWRADPGFVLNRSEYDGARVLVAGPNFGSGSSREHAAWALQDYGFAAVISSRFADIFRGNSLKIGLLPVELPAETVDKLMAAVAADPTIEVTVDLESGTVSAPAAGVEAGFEIDDFTRYRLMNGLDDIGLTLQHDEAIAAFEAGRPGYLPSVGSAPAGLTVTERYSRASVQSTGNPDGERQRRVPGNAVAGNRAQAGTPSQRWNRFVLGQICRRIDRRRHVCPAVSASPRSPP
jgi:3-isopropylmalate/(R)-2-methylmalate dehydratase small subunit